MDYVDILVEKVKQGDDSAFTELLNIHKKMIYKLIYNNNLVSGDFLIDADSLFQEGSLGLYNAVFSFEEDKGMKFTSYAYMVIRTRINTYIRDHRILKDECYSIDNKENIDYQSMMSSLLISENPVEYHHQKEFERKLAKFVANLSHEDKQIIELRYYDVSYKQISERLQIKQKRVDNRLRALRKKLKDYLENE